jgi:hypothetical protein
MSSSNEWQDVQTKSAKQAQKKKVAPPASIKTLATKPVAYRSPIAVAATNPQFYCIQCYTEHANSAEFDRCDSKICHYCALPLSSTHIENKCTAATCTRCNGKHGHDDTACHIPLCSFCDEVGHTPHECPTLKDTECEKCGELGHTKNHCPTRFTCEYCDRNEEKDKKHRMTIFDKKLHKKVVVCEKILRAQKNGSYICPRCAYEDCLLTCKN